MPARSILTLSLALVFASPALAQSEADILRGPKVDQTRMPGVEAQFGSSPMSQQMTGRMVVPQREFEKMLGKLNSDKADPAIRLTDEQSEQVRAIQAEHSKAYRAYVVEHAEEIRALREKAGMGGGRAVADRRRGSDKTDNDAMSDDAPSESRVKAPKPTKEQEAARTALRELMSGAPKGEHAQTKIYAVLTDDQRVFMDEQVEAYRTAQLAKRDEGRMERFKREAEADFEKRQKNGAGAQRAIPDEISDEMLASMRLPERAKERLAGMTPSERSQALKQMRERASRRDRD